MLLLESRLEMLRVLTKIKQKVTKLCEVIDTLINLFVVIIPQCTCPVVLFKCVQYLLIMPHGTKWRIGLAWEVL